MKNQLFPKEKLFFTIHGLFMFVKNQLCPRKKCVFGAQASEKPTFSFLGKPKNPTFSTSLIVPKQVVFFCFFWFGHISDLEGILVHINSLLNLFGINTKILGSWIPVYRLDQDSTIFVLMLIKFNKGYI